MIPIFLDISNLSSIQNLIKNTIDQCGRIDVLVNNAGFGRVGWLENLDIQGDIEHQIQVNLIGLIEITRLVLPTMIQQRYGHIINIGSISGFIGSPTYSIYAASKFGVRGFSEALRREVSVWGIHVSTIFPGTVKTEFGLHTGAVRKTGVTTPNVLQLKPEYIANTIHKMIKSPRRRVIIPKIYLLAIWFNEMLPSLGDYFMRKYFVYPERIYPERIK